jgi:hypothetical protein
MKPKLLKESQHKSQTNSFGSYYIRLIRVVGKALVILSVCKVKIIAYHKHGIFGELKSWHFSANCPPTELFFIRTY